MKNNNESVCVYRNLGHIQRTKAQLEISQKRLQNLLDEWGQLEIGECTDIGELLMNPERIYKTTIDKLVDVPEAKGRFAVKKESVLDTLELPDPSRLYTLAKETRQQPYCISLELWDIEDNKIVLNEAEAEILCNSQSIFASSPDNIRLIKDLNKFCELYNSLNKRLNGELLNDSPWTFNHFRYKFSVTQQSYPGLFKIEPEIEFLRRISQASL